MTEQERKQIIDALGNWNVARLKRQSIEKEHPELIQILQNELDEIPEYESIGCVAKSIVLGIQLKHCRNCGRLLTYKNSVSKKPVIEYCSLHCAHSSDEIKQKKAETTKLHYGVEHPLQNKELSEKAQKTLHERFGDDPYRSGVIRDKIIATNLKRYGTECVLGSEEIQEKIRKTNLERYGYEIASMSDEIKEREKQSNLKKYGVISTAMLQETRQKAIETNRRKYGVDWHLQSDEQKAKMRATMQEKYGVDWASQTEESRRKCHKINNRKTYDSFARWKDYIVPMFSMEEYDGWKQDKHYMWKCQKCGESFYWNKYDCSGRVPICHKCMKKSGTSQMEKEILEYVNFIYGGKVITNTRKVLGNMELDIYMPDRGVAIEFDGLYWHAEEKHLEGYHVAKTNRCMELGIRLLHVFEDEWLSRRGAIESVIADAIGIKGVEMDANECEIRKISCTVASEFYIENSPLYGGRKTRMNYGMFHGNELVYAMSFSTSKFNSSFKYQLVSLASKKSCHIQGAERKIIDEFKKEHQSKSIVFYSDRRYLSREQLYFIGMKYLKSTHVNYYWTHSQKRFSRNQVVHHVIDIVGEGYNPNLSVEENMVFAGWKKIFDCGFDVFEM